MLPVFLVRSGTTVVWPTLELAFPGLSSVAEADVGLEASPLCPSDVASVSGIVLVVTSGVGGLGRALFRDDPIKKAVKDRVVV